MASEQASDGVSGDAKTPDPEGGAGVPAPEPGPGPAPGPASVGPAAPAAGSVSLTPPKPAAPKPAAKPATPAPSMDGAVAQGKSPYDHLLKIRGDVDSTKAIALFLAGLMAFVAVWSVLTAGGRDVRGGKEKVGADGTLTIPLSLERETPVWVEGYDLLEDATKPLGETDVRFTPPSTLELPKAAAGTEVTWGADLGREPIVSHFLLPKPSQVLTTLIELTTGAGEETHGTTKVVTQSKHFRAGILSSLLRTTVGFLVAVALVLPLAIVAGSYPPIARFMGPLEVAGGYAPPVALLPLAIALSGFLNTNQVASAATSENMARIAFLVVVIAFWLYPLVVKEVAAVEQVFVNTAYTLGASRSQVVLRVLVPIAAGRIWEHLRACYAIGWASIILAEGYASSQTSGEYGVGFFMATAQRRHAMEAYFAAVAVIILVGLAIDNLFKVVGRKLFPWQEGA